MFSRRLLAGLLILGAGASLSVPALAQKDKDKEKPKPKEVTPPKETGKVTLAWNFGTAAAPAKEFFQTMTTTTEQTMTVMNNKVTQKQKQTFIFSWKPLALVGDKWTIEQKILGVAMDIDIGGSKIQYDSQKENPNNPLAEFFKALENATFTITLNAKTLKVEGIKGREEFLKKLVTANPQMKPLLDTILSEDALKEMAEPTFAVIPTDAVTPGKSWPKTTTLDMGPIGKYKNVYKYTYKGREGKDEKGTLHRIDVETTLTYTPPADGTDARGLPFKIKSADLKSENATGSVLFDNALGRVQSSKMSLDLRGDLSIEIGGQTTKVTLAQKQTSEVTTSSESPIQKR